MSLLLDALKKAADDKAKASQNESVSTEPATTEQPEPELNLQSDADTSSAAPSDYKSENIDELSLELDALEESETTSSERVIENGDGNAGSEAMVEHGEKILAMQPQEKETLDQAGEQVGEQAGEQTRARPRSYRVSDDALSMLINKTNREVKRDKRIVVFGVLFISLVILVAGGFYYYMDMQAEIANLERKHKIAMQSMRAKTNNEIPPEKSEIIRKLVGESDLDEKVQYAKKHIADDKNTKKTVPKTRTSVVAAKNTSSVSAGQLSIEKTNKTDPVGDKLEEAWQAYESARYDDAGRLYGDVLDMESNNRDALLGLGAIAVIQKDNVKARAIYLALLELDPRDPIATAALASLHSDVSSLDSDEKYLISMLQKNPEAPHLNFSLGNIYAQQSKWGSAQKSYFAAWQADSENADYVFNLAVSMDQLGKSEQAIDLYRDSLLKSNNKQVSFSRDAARNRINELTGL